MFRTASLIIKSCLVFFFLFSCAGKKSNSLPYYNSPDFTPHFISDQQKINDSITHRTGSFNFLNQHGESISDETVNGKIHVASFIFTSCRSICPRMIENLKILEEAFRSDTSLVILSFSVTPWIDSVPVLKKFADRQQIFSPNWHLLTGDRGEIYTLARRSYFAEEALGYSRDSTEFLHTEHILLADKSQRLRGIYNGTLQLEVLQLIEDIKLLKAE
jgi:protein SCO1